MVLVTATPGGHRPLERGRAVAHLLEGASPRELAVLRSVAELIGARLHQPEPGQPEPR